MRRILIDNARKRKALRHGGEFEKVRADATGFDVAAPQADEDLLLLHEALEDFAVHDARAAELVKLNSFAGLTLEEAAKVLGVTERTAKRDWAYAKAWLFTKIGRLRSEKH
jgi:RNA polymerase sigma factor (TIGR02999 family)